jgi:hypothetical protein
VDIREQVAAWNEALNKVTVPMDELRTAANDEDQVVLSGSYVARIPEGRKNVTPRNRGTYDDTFHATVPPDRAREVVEDFLRRWPHV